MLTCKYPVMIVVEGTNVYDEFKARFDAEIKLDQLIVLDKDVIGLATVIIAIINRKIKSVIFQDCGFDKADNDLKLNYCYDLEEVQFINCRNEFTAMLSCLKIKTLKTVVNGKHEKLWRRFDIPHLVSCLEDIVNQRVLNDNYRLIRFEIGHYQQYFTEISNNRKLSKLTNKAVSAQQSINWILRRNLNGYQRCRKVIYTLFLIKKYSNHPIMTLMDRNILMMIGKEILTSIGDRIWCDRW